MRSITEILVRTADLAEAEGRVLRAMTIRVALGVSVIVVATAAMGGGLALLLASLYIFVADRAGSAPGALVAGVVALAIGGTLAWVGRRITT